MNVLLRSPLHGIEAFRFMGWDLQFWEGKDPASHGFSHQFLIGLAGNAWNGFAYSALAIATFGSVWWAEATRLRQERALAPVIDVDEDLDEHERSSSLSNGDGESNGSDSL